MAAEGLVDENYANANELLSIEMFSDVSGGSFLRFV